VKKNPKESTPLSQYILYLGCTVPVRALQYEISARKVAERLDIQLVDIPEFSCCGYPIKSVNHDAYLLLAARNLALAEKRGLPICTLCSSCGGTLAEAAHEIQEDENLRKRINDNLSAWIGMRYEGNVSVLHFIRVLHQSLGRTKISEQVKVDLSSLRFAPHYGCHYTKPSNILGRTEDPENPTSLDELIEATGAQSIFYEDKLACCGGGVLAIDEQVALAMAQRKLDHIRTQQADALVLICPFCGIMYESNQRKIEKTFGAEYKLPVLYYPQLLGLALGLDPDELGLKMNRVKTTELMKKIQRRSN
jgi:heterodisulfide reductase subunit B